MNLKVAANIVTYNRKELLLECLASLISQTVVLDAIFIIDNHSSDGTGLTLYEKGYIGEIPDVGAEKVFTSEKFYCLDKSLLTPDSQGKIDSAASAHFIKIFYVYLPENTGSSGGQYEGLKRASELGYDWIWLMDDDVVCDCNSLKNLLNKIEIGENVGYFCSKVLNPDGEVMNVPIIDMSFSETMYPSWPKYLDYGMIPVTFATFVSLLVKAEVVKDVGLPIKNLFIWADDSEFTKRMSLKYKGYLVGNSIVIHKRAMSSPPSLLYEEDANRIKNFFYAFRNTLYVEKKYGTNGSLFKYIIWLVGHALKILCFKKNKMRKLSVIIKGSASGLFFHPVIEYPKSHH